jgi:transcriptional regulator with XRE-family HTH domain
MGTKTKERGNLIVVLDLKRIRAERIHCGYTQEDMAAKLGMTRGSYAKREAGMVKIGANELANIAAALGYSRDRMGIFFTPDVPVRKRSE